MPVDVIGRYPLLERRRTGLFSLDMALRNVDKLGLPLRTITEIYGYTNAGKSTLAYFLAGKVAQENRIAICDLEFCDREYVRVCMEHSGFNGVVALQDFSDDKGKPITHERMLLMTARELHDEGCKAIIMDSIGAVQPNVEKNVLMDDKEKELGQAFMGKRAKLVGQFARALTDALRTKDAASSAFVINHVHSIIGGMGHVTAGGDTLKYMAAVRLMIWPDTTYYVDPSAPTDVLGFLVSGQVEKLRYGGRGKKFRFYIVPGYGVHTGATAMFDCLKYGLATSDAKVKIGDKSIGYLRADLLKAAAQGNTRKFAQFEEELASAEERILINEVQKGDADEDTGVETKPVGRDDKEAED